MRTKRERERERKREGERANKSDDEGKNEKEGLRKARREWETMVQFRRSARCCENTEN